jgi:hypothetical protein
LTATANGSLNSTGIDGVTTLAVSDRVLVKDEVTSANNGIFDITDLGSSGTAPAIPTAVTPPTPSGATLLVGSTRTYTTIAAALVAASNGDRLLLDAETFTLATTLTVSKSVTIEGSSRTGTIIQSAGTSGDPVTLINISVGNVTFQTLTVKHRKTTNTSIETAISVSPAYTATGHYFEQINVECVEFGIVIGTGTAGTGSSGWQIANSHLAYVGPNNSTRRLLAVYRSEGSGLFIDSTYDSGQDGVITGVTRLIQLTSGGAGGQYSGTLAFVNLTPSNAYPLSQFFNCDAFSAPSSPLTLIVSGCTAAETSAFVVFFGSFPALGQCAGGIVLRNNTLTNAHGKGALALDGSVLGASAGSTTLYVGGNTLTSTAFVAGWATGVSGSPVPADAALLGYKTAGYAFPNQALTAYSTGTPWVLTRSSDADTSALVLRGIFCAVNEGTVNNSTSWILVTPDVITLNTTGLIWDCESTQGTTVVQVNAFSIGTLIRYDGSNWVTAQADSDTNSDVDGLVIQATGSYFRYVLPWATLNIFSGLTPGLTYFLSPSVAGAYTSTEPTTTGEVTKPVLRALSSTNAIFVGFRGAVIQ